MNIKYQGITYPFVVIIVLDRGEVMVYENPDYSKVGPHHSRNLQWIKCNDRERVFAVANVHGLWNGKGKGDTPERIFQSRNIKKTINNLHMPHILCGDLNLTLQTRSLRILDSDMRNCITEYGVRSTRTRYYEKEEKYADYMILSKGIKINKFKVLPDEVSDHSPLFLDFDLEEESI
ncbi:MAG: hypothetical protein QNJ27_00995 [Simkaniaceae bacterium]|nr:hypothetical protein [Simkaniaceae bacterium]